MELIVRTFSDDLKQHQDKTYQYHEIESLAKSQLLPAGYRVVFITGNKNKVAELEQGLNKHVKLSVLDVDLPEIQHSDVLKIVQEKCRHAFDHVGNRPEVFDGSQKKIAILIEDTCLNFKALNGMPGPYVKWFLKAVGPDGLHKMLAGFEDKSAEAICTYALMKASNEIVFMRGIVRGQITQPRGDSWGWDPIFEEERSRLTFGEMEPALKCKFSHRANALTVFKKYFTISAN